jgi:hypothetical protein
VKYARAGRYLVPLESRAAARYFRTSLRVAYSPVGRLLAPLPRYDAKLDDVPAEVPALFDAINEPVVPAILLLDYASAGRGRTVAFLFRDQSPLPSAIVKVRQSPSGGASLRAEADAHVRLHALLPRELRATVPHVLRFDERADAEVLMLSTVPGRSAYLDMQNSLWPSRYVDAHFDAASRWLSAFHDVTSGASHGDFWARNLLIDESGRAGVVDWELFAHDASPLFDLFHFPLTYGLNWPWTRYRQLPPEAAFVKTFLASNRVSRAVRRYLQTYATERGLTMPYLQEAFRTFLLQIPLPTGEGGAQRRGSGQAPPGTAHLPWPALAAQFNRASESVFSG